MVSLSLVEQIDLADVRLTVTVSGTGPVVVLAHGFPDDASTWQAQVGALVAAGYRAVVPTMRGYAPSGVAKSGRYDLDALGHDLLALADRYSPREPVRLVGHDWGAAASYAAAAIAPERVACLASLAVPHMRAFLRAAMTSRQALRSSYMLLFQLRGIAEAIVEARDLAFVDLLWRRWSPGYAPTASEMEAVKAGLCGRVPEALAYYRAIPKALASAPMTRLLLGPTKVPTLHLHGADDGCIGAAAIEGAARYHAASYEAHVIPRAGHFLQREQPEAVNERLLAYLGRFA
jgi:pimeloyl-ACP methyl ester carboxylesterase